MNVDDNIPLRPSILPRRLAPLASRYLDEIYPNLWLGSLQAAESAEILQTCGITDIISITSHRPRIPPNLGITKTHFRLRDNTEADLLSILPDCIRKIEEVMSAPPLAPGAPERKVLVHCRMGISRSGGMVVAYAMKHANIPARLALEFVRSRRPIVNPNKAFMAQLTVWGECGYDTALLMPDMAAPEEDEPSEEEMLQMALEMSLAAAEEGETLPAAPGRLVVVNPDRVVACVDGGAVVGVGAQDMEMAEAATCTDAPTTTITITADTAPATTAAHTPPHAQQLPTDTDIDTEMPTIPPAATQPQPQAAATTLHAAQRMHRAAAAEQEQWVDITMDHGTRLCFDACVRDVGGGAR